MAWELKLFDVSFEAGEDLSDAQFLAVTLNNAGKVVKVSSTGAKAIGILQDNPPAGSGANVRMLGISKVKSGSAFAVGAVLASDGTGRLIPATAGSGYYPIGVALEAATAADQIVTAFILPEKKAL